MHDVLKWSISWQHASQPDYIVCTKSVHAFLHQHLPIRLKILEWYTPVFSLCPWWWSLRAAVIAHARPKYAPNTWMVIDPPTSAANSSEVRIASFREYTPISIRVITIN